MDDVLLGPGSGRKAASVGKESLLSSGGGSKNGDGCKKSEAVARRRGEFTATSRAVGMAMILYSLRQEEGEDSSVGDGGQSNAYRWMRTLLAQRASLQNALAIYLDARSRSRKCTPGSEKALTTDAEAIEKLEAVASLTAPLHRENISTKSSSASKSLSSFSTDPQSVLKRLHEAKDNHIFRILSTISRPAHLPEARARAFDELPKRTKALGDTTSSWVRTLARRCAMGGLVNAEAVTHCILLAQECFAEDDVEGAMLFLRSVRTAVSAFPALGATGEGFATLVELFGECRSSRQAASARRKVESSGMVTVLSAVLAAVAPARAQLQASPGAAGVSGGKSPKKKSKTDEPPLSSGLEPSLQSQLLRLCVRDGTPEQARHAVFTLAALINPLRVTNGFSGTSSVKGSRKEMGPKRDQEAFGPLMKALTSPSRLSITKSGGRGGRVVSILAGLAALVEVAPGIFCDKRGDRAIRFALESVLLGRGDAPGDGREGSDLESDDEDEDREDKSGDEGDDRDVEEELQGKHRRSKGKVNRGKKGSVDEPGDKDAGGENGDHLSFACRRVCAAVEVLVCHIRSTISQQKKELQTQADAGKESRTHSSGKKATHLAGADAVQQPPPEHITAVFGTLVQILQDSGLPPSSRDRRDCRSSQDKAALRKCVTVNLLRLCDPALQLEGRYLTAGSWHVLSRIFLDEDTSVRLAAMEELGFMLTGVGCYRHIVEARGSAASSFAPGLRFLALTCLCPDGEHGNRHSSANGHAAYVGRQSTVTRAAAQQCASFLRRTAQATLAQCRALGSEAERQFELRFRTMLMPEYAIPYALHLLSFRRETPSAGGTEAGGGPTVLVSVAPQGGDREQEEVEENEEAMVADEEARQRMLRKRLRWLMEPLVESLGEGADNISFLLRMTDLLGNKYQPIDVSTNEIVSTEVVSAAKSLNASFGSETDISMDGAPLCTPDANMRHSCKSHAKLRIVCVAAREVLLGFVKKDVNLTPYPGALQVPSALFARTITQQLQSGGGKKTPSSAVGVESALEVEKETNGEKAKGAKPKENASKGEKFKKGKKLFDKTPQKKRGERHVVFSPDLEDHRTYLPSPKEYTSDEKEHRSKRAKRAMKRSLEEKSSPKLSPDLSNKRKGKKARPSTEPLDVIAQPSKRSTRKSIELSLALKSPRRNARKRDESLQPSSPAEVERKHTNKGSWGSPIAKSESPSSVGTSQVTLAAPQSPRLSLEGTNSHNGDSFSTPKSVTVLKRRRKRRSEEKFKQSKDDYPVTAQANVRTEESSDTPSDRKRHSTESDKNSGHKEKKAKISMGGTTTSVTSGDRKKTASLAKKSRRKKTETEFDFSDDNQAMPKQVNDQSFTKSKTKNSKNSRASSRTSVKSKKKKKAVTSDRSLSSSSKASSAPSRRSRRGRS